LHVQSSVISTEANTFSKKGGTCMVCMHIKNVSVKMAGNYM